ncbi:ChaN family lipoprotein [Geomonas sp. Red32]|uniref:ChaN family lipoprotein n=1 Tax=Geomonas sp. Red32 TaxID=2912856 RepID=UPI00202CC15E|nr:ChaN family lipoprotein [Geomonas sp. Red32]
MTGKAILVLLMLLSIQFAPTPGQADENIVRMRDGMFVSYRDLLDAAAGSDLVLFGETHDNRGHHQMQLNLVRSLWERDVPLAIGLEMVSTEGQQALDDWVEGKIDEAAFRTIFTAGWPMDWTLYRGIFMYAREKRIPMVALNIPAPLVRKVAQRGFSSLTAEERKGLPEGASCDLNTPHTAFLKKTFLSIGPHRAVTSTFTYFCEAQALRNSGMALNVARYLKRHPGTRMVVLTGIWHAIKAGIPVKLDQDGGHFTSTVILPLFPDLLPQQVGPDNADYMVEF